MSAAQTTIESDADYVVDYLQTHNGMYGNGMEMWMDGFSFAVDLNCVFSYPRRNEDTAAVVDDQIVARGTVDQIYNDNERGLVLEASPCAQVTW